jgi:hypothetical protein
MKVRKKVLVTTLLKPGEASKNELGKLFVQRWQVEVDLRNIKTTLAIGNIKDTHIFDMSANP